MANIAMLYHGNNEDLHPAHRGFGESIDADVLSVSNTSPHSAVSFYQELSHAYSIGKYDIVIAEGSRPLYTGLIHKILYDSKVVYLCSDHRLQELWNNSTNVHSLYTLLKYLLGSYGKSLIRAIIQNGVDGIIAISDVVVDYIRPITREQVPIRIAHPYIQPRLFDQLGNIKPNLNGKVVLTVGRSTQYKGADILVEAWPTVREKHPEAELHVVGKDHPKSYAETTGVHVHGYIENLVNVYAEASLYVQPSRIEPFGVAVLEALRAGLPAIVTKSTGTKSEIKRLDTRLISSATSYDLSEAINWYFTLSPDKKSELSNTAKKRGEQFNPQIRKRAFRETFKDLVTDIDE